MTTDGPAMKHHLLHPSGGLVWHWRALRNRRRWGSLNTALAGWLSQWTPPSPRLLLVGPSAGWTLPRDFLLRFTDIRALEPDPVARQLLKRRFESVSFRFDGLDLFSENGFEALSRYADHAVLFCNVLGQLCPTDESEAENWCYRLRSALAGHHWASYHDLTSCERQPDITLRQDFTPDTCLDEVLAHYWSEGRLDIRDHNTMAVARNLPFSCVPWQLSGRQWHLLQWCQSAPL